LNNLINVECYLVDKVFFGLGYDLLNFGWILLSFKLWQSYHHVFNDAHSVFV